MPPPKRSIRKSVTPKEDADKSKKSRVSPIAITPCIITHSLPRTPSSPRATARSQNLPPSHLVRRAERMLQRHTQHILNPLSRELRLALAEFRELMQHVLLGAYQSSGRGLCILGIGVGGSIVNLFPDSDEIGPVLLVLPVRGSGRGGLVGVRTAFSEFEAV